MLLQKRQKSLCDVLKVVSYVIEGSNYFSLPSADKISDRVLSNLGHNTLRKIQINWTDPRGEQQE